MWSRTRCFSIRLHSRAAIERAACLRRPERMVRSGKLISFDFVVWTLGESGASWKRVLEERVGRGCKERKLEEKVRRGC